MSPVKSTPVRPSDYASPHTVGLPPSYGGVAVGHHITSDLTPVISNSNAMYVDGKGSNTKAMPGFVIVSPNNPTVASTTRSRATGNYSPDDDNPSGSSAARGLAPRSQSRGGRGMLPPMRNDPMLSPPKERVSLKDSAGNVSGTTGGSGGAVRGGEGVSPLEGGMVSSAGVSNASSPYSPGLLDESTDGLGVLIGEGLSMPSGLYSDESSLENITEGRRQRRGGGDMFRKGSGSGANQQQRKEEKQILAPIELTPNRKFFSFQGSYQYKQSIAVPSSQEGGEGTDPSPFACNVEPIQASSPSRRPPMSPTRIARGAGDVGNRQYQPSLRGAHGVGEMADTKDLDAIFKASSRHPVTTALGGAASLQQPMIVSPAVGQGRPALSIMDYHNEESTAHLRQTIPMDERQWSIPSIRLANHVNNSGLDSSLHSYQDMSRTFSDDEYTEEGGASFDESCSYLGDEDDASLSSKESYDQVRRWRRISGVLRRGDSAGSCAIAAQPSQTLSAENVAAVNTDTASSGIPAIARSTSFLERNLGRISIENKRSSTFEDSENEVATDQWSPPPSIHGPPPILNVSTPHSIDDAAVDYHGDENAIRTRTSITRHHGSRSRRHPHRGRRKKGRTQSGSAAAFEWLHDLQNQTPFNGGIAIAEAASSKFLTGVGSSSGVAVGAGGGGYNATDASSEDVVTKALGMPHPLCRSSTIEAAQFVHRGEFGVSRHHHDVAGGTNDIMGVNSIALTSSGSS